MTRRIGLFIKVCEHTQLYTWTIWIIRYRSLEILYYEFKIKQTSTDIPAQDHFTDTSTSEKSV